MSQSKKAVVIDSRDNVATAISELESGERVELDGGEVVLREPIQFGHKFALVAIPEGSYVMKYGARIGRATQAIQEGEHVHIHNVQDITDEVRKEV